MFFFSAKMVVPVFANIRSEEKLITEKQEEKSGEKSENIKTDVAEIVHAHPVFELRLNQSFFHIATHPFLAVQYYATPTPPPWA